MRRKLSLYYAALSADEAASLLAAAGGFLTGRRPVADARWSGVVADAMAGMMQAAAAFAFPSARSALFATLRAMGVGSGHEVIVTGYTCAAVPAAVVYCGATPVYVDIDARTFNMNPGLVGRAVSPRTRAIIVQHTYGNPAPVDAILETARSHRLPVIEDCCLALGSRDRGRPVGVRGDAGIVSFELSKTLSAGWGGVVWLNGPALREAVAAQQAACRAPSRLRAARLAWQVALSYALYHPSGYRAGRYLAAALYRSRLFRASTTSREARGGWPDDYLTRISDAHWAVLARQLDRLPEITASSRRAAAAYREVLDRHGVDSYPRAAPDAAPAWVRFPFLVADRPAFQAHFARLGVEVGRWFDAPVSGDGPSGAFAYVPGCCPVAEVAARHVVNLPVSTRLSPEDVDRIAGALDGYLRRHPERRGEVGVRGEVALHG